MVAANHYWDSRNPAFLDNQLATYDEMRQRCPVAHDDSLGWSVFRHADVVDVIADHKTYSSKVSTAHPALPNGYDPPEHTVYRTLIDRYFRQDDVAAYEPLFRAVADELVTGLPGHGEVEFIDRFALTYALRTQQAWLQWPDDMTDALREWMGKNHRAKLAGDRDALTQVAQHFDEAIRRVIVDRREHPGGPGDVTTRLLAETIDGVVVSEEMIVSILRNWTVGELGTMSASVGIIVEYLARHGDLQDHLRAHPEDLDAAIHEILRIHPPLLTNRRVTTQPVELGGRHLAAGERVTVFWAGANRDETVFGDPDEYAPKRNAPHNLLYGRGVHYCPGEQLARLELRVALECILAGTRTIRMGKRTAQRAVFPASGFETLPLAILR